MWMWGWEMFCFSFDTYALSIPPNSVKGERPGTLPQTCLIISSPAQLPLVPLARAAFLPFKAVIPALAPLPHLALPSLEPQRHVLACKDLENFPAKTASCQSILMVIWSLSSFCISVCKGWILTLMVRIWFWGVSE